MTTKTTTAALKVAAKKEVKVVNESPRYNLRLANKLAKGREAKDVGVNVENLKNLYNRVIEAFGSDGFWWDSVVTDGKGGLIVSMRPLRLNEWCKEDDIMQYRGVTYKVKCGRWSVANIITSAAIRLKQAEDLAITFDAPFIWQELKKAKKAKKVKKQSSAKTLLEELNKKIAKGTITKEAAFNIFAAAI